MSDRRLEKIENNIVTIRENIVELKTLLKTQVDQHTENKENQKKINDNYAVRISSIENIRNQLYGAGLMIAFLGTTFWNFILRKTGIEI